jgi:hypothetical protein
LGYIIAVLIELYPKGAILAALDRMTLERGSSLHSILQFTAMLKLAQVKLSIFACENRENDLLPVNLGIIVICEVMKRREKKSNYIQY